MPKQHESDPHMNDGQVHEISARIGGLQRSVEMMTDMWAKQEEAATTGRRALHEKFELFRDEVRIKMDSLSLRVDSLAATVRVIEPSVHAFNDDKLRDEGAKRLGKMLWMAMTAAAGVVGYGIHEVIGYFKH